MVYLLLNVILLRNISNNLNKAYNPSFICGEFVQVKKHRVYSLCFLFVVFFLYIFYSFLELQVLGIRDFIHRYFVKEDFTQLSCSTLQFGKRISKTVFE